MMKRKLLSLSLFYSVGLWSQVFSFFCFLRALCSLFPFLVTRYSCWRGAEREMLWKWWKCKSAKVIHLFTHSSVRAVDTLVGDDEDGVEIEFFFFFFEIYQRLIDDSAREVISFATISLLPRVAIVLCSFYNLPAALSELVHPSAQCNVYLFIVYLSSLDSLSLHLSLSISTHRRTL